MAISEGVKANIMSIIGHIHFLAGKINVTNIAPGFLQRHLIMQAIVKKTKLF